MHVQYVSVWVMFALVGVNRDVLELVFVFACLFLCSPSAPLDAAISIVWNEESAHFIQVRWCRERTRERKRENVFESMFLICRAQIIIFFFLL